MSERSSALSKRIQKARAGRVATLKKARFTPSMAASVAEQTGATRQELRMVQDIQAKIAQLNRTRSGRMLVGAYGFGCGGVTC